MSRRSVVVVVVVPFSGRSHYRCDTNMLHAGNTNKNSVDSTRLLYFHTRTMILWFDC